MSQSGAKCEKNKSWVEQSVKRTSHESKRVHENCNTLLGVAFAILTKQAYLIELMLAWQSILLDILALKQVQVPFQSFIFQV